MSKRKLIFSAVVSLGLAILPQPKAEASECGYVSHYGRGDSYNGSITSNGERFNMWANTTAHPWLPMGTRLRVTDQRTRRSVIVRVNDRGPFVSGRILDLSYGAFSQIRNPSVGETYVCYSRLN